VILSPALPRTFSPSATSISREELRNLICRGRKAEALAVLGCSRPRVEAMGSFGARRTTAVREKKRREFMKPFTVARQSVLP